jgi:hypothetical protein
MLSQSNLQLGNIKIAKPVRGIKQPAWTLHGFRMSEKTQNSEL